MGVRHFVKQHLLHKRLDASASGEGHGQGKGSAAGEAEGSEPGRRGGAKGSSSPKASASPKGKISNKYARAAMKRAVSAVLEKQPDPTPPSSPASSAGTQSPNATAQQSLARVQARMNASAAARRLLKARHKADQSTKLHQVRFSRSLGPRETRQQEVLRRLRQGAVRIAVGRVTNKGVTALPRPHGSLMLLGTCVHVLSSGGVLALDAVSLNHCCMPCSCTTFTLPTHVACFALLPAAADVVVARTMRIAMRRCGCTTALWLRHQRP